MTLTEYNCYGCAVKNCDGCRDFSKYKGELGTRIYMTDKEIEETCNDCSCYFECHRDKFDLEYARECYNIKFSCNEED